MAGKYFLVDEHDQVTEWEDVDTPGPARAGSGPRRAALRRRLCLRPVLPGRLRPPVRRARAHVPAPGGLVFRSRGPGRRGRVVRTIGQYVTLLLVIGFVGAYSGRSH
jgi:hypothetical protein